MANAIFNPTYNSDGASFGGGGWRGVRAGFVPGSGTVVGTATSNVVLGNASVTVVQVPYGQTWPRG